MPSLSKPGIVHPIQQTTGVLVQKIRVNCLSYPYCKTAARQFSLSGGYLMLKAIFRVCRAMLITEISTLHPFSPLKDWTLEKHTPQTKAETKLLQIVAIIKPQLSLQVVLITGKAIRHRITFCRPYILLIIHPPSAFAGGTSPKSRVQRRRCRKECISS